MALSTAEIQSLRFHLGYGNLDTPAQTYTLDGFYELFRDVVAPNLETGAMTTSSTATTAGATTTITLASVTGFAAYTPFVADVGDEAEVTIAKAVSGSTVTARFEKAHAAGFPVAVMSGEARLRMLLWDADIAWKKAQNASITKTAGLKQLGQGEIEWFGGGQVLADTMNHYRSIQKSISDLVRVLPAEGSDGSGGCARLEAY